MQVDRWVGRRVGGWAETEEREKASRYFFHKVKVILF